MERVVHGRATRVVGMHLAPRTLHTVGERKRIRHDLKLLRIEPHLLHHLKQIVVERRVGTPGIGTGRLARDFHCSESYGHSRELHAHSRRRAGGGHHEVHERRGEAEVHDAQVIGAWGELGKGEHAAIVREGLPPAANQADHRVVERCARAQHNHIPDERTGSTGRAR